MTQRRERRAGQCPRCGADLILTEQAAEIAEPGVPPQWLPVSRRCADGCLLTVHDFPQE
jgi:hypothetical protein